MRKVTKEFWKKLLRCEGRPVPHVEISFGGLYGDAGLHYEQLEDGKRPFFSSSRYYLNIKNPDYYDNAVVREDKIEKLEQLLQLETEEETKEFLGQLLQELKKLPKVSAAELLK